MRLEKTICLTFTSSVIYSRIKVPRSPGKLRQNIQIMRKIDSKMIPRTLWIETKENRKRSNQTFSQSAGSQMRQRQT